MNIAPADRIRVLGNKKLLKGSGSKIFWAEPEDQHEFEIWYRSGKLLTVEQHNRQRDVNIV